MIKLERENQPSELSDEVAQQLTEEYKHDNGKAVWRKPYIINSLLRMSHCKCSYCEVRLIEEGKYMQVDHYHHKKKYPDEVVKWDNLIPACNRCNTQKGTHDTYAEPIVNPYIDDPKDFLYMENYRIKSRNNNKKGLDTISVLYLNDMEGLVLPRFRIGNTVQEKIIDIQELLESYNADDKSSRKKNKIINTMKDILKAARTDNEYSALVATVLMQDEAYYNVRQNLKSSMLWDDEMEALHGNVERIALMK